MGLLSTFLGFLGFVFGLPLGLIIGFFFFVYSKPKEIKDPVITPLVELDSITLQSIIPEIPNWIKSPDCDRVDWLNKFLLNMWPYLDKAICEQIRSTVEPMFGDYIGQYQIDNIEFENLSLGTLPPTLQGMKVYETNENELVMEPSIKWAGNPNIVVAVTSSLMSLKIRLQLVDLQIFATPRIHLKPLVPTFPCFSTIVVSLMEKPHVDFGLNVLGGDIMAIPGLYRFVQETIKEQVASLYHWPLFLEIPVLDSSISAVKKPVGILHVNVVRGIKLLKMDLIGASDPYVKLRLSGERMAAKKTSTKMKTLNPEWNEKFKLIVKDPQTQTLEFQVYDWDKVGGHDRIGMQIVPLKQLTPNETKEFTLDLVKNSNMSEYSQSKKARGQLVVELTFDPFKYDSNNSFKWSVSGLSKKQLYTSNLGSPTEDEPSLNDEAGVLVVTIIGAEDLEGEHHTNPYAQVIFRGELRKTMVVRKNRNPRWNADFEFMIEEPPLNEKLHIEVLSKTRSLRFSRKESLGYVDIALVDVVHNGRINEKYHLINSKNGILQVEIEWQTT